MHTVARWYPDYPDASDMRSAREFYTSLRSLLPCPQCAEHYATLLEQYPISAALHNRAELMRWTWTIHDAVNQRLGKQSPPLAVFLSSMGHEDDGETVHGLIVAMVVGVLIAVTAVVVARRAHRRAAD